MLLHYNARKRSAQTDVKKNVTTRERHYRALMTLSSKRGPTQHAICIFGLAFLGLGRRGGNLARTHPAVRAAAYTREPTTMP